MRHAMVCVLASLVAATALSACRVHIPPKYDNKPVAPASATAPATERAQ